VGRSAFRKEPEPLFVHTPLAYIASFVIWMALFLCAVIICLRKGTEAIFVSLFSFFTVSGIISSFIISYDFPADISARFFVSAVCFAIVMVVLAFSLRKGRDCAGIPALYCLFSLFLSGYYEAVVRPGKPDVRLHLLPEKE
jgi:FtsH-binding integral membrane protein